MQVNLHGIQNCVVVKAKHEVRVYPCLLSSNKSRPHLYTYVDLIKDRKRAVLVCTWSWTWPRAAKCEAFSSTRGANSLQFSLKVGVLHLDNLNISWICQGCRYEVRKLVLFRIRGKLLCKATANGFKKVQIAYLAVISYLDKLVQPSYTLSMQIRPLALPRAS